MGDDEYSPRHYSLGDARHRRRSSVTSPGVAPPSHSILSTSTSPLHSPAYEPLAPHARASATAPPEAYQPTSPHLPPHLGTPQGGYMPSESMLPPSAYPTHPARHHPPHHHQPHRGHRYGSHQPAPGQGSVPPSSSPYLAAREPEYDPIAARATPVRPHRPPPSRSYATPTTAYSHARTLADWELQPSPQQPPQPAYDPLQVHVPQRTSPFYNSPRTGYLTSTSSLDDDDISTPLVYLCRPMTIKAFIALKPQFSNHLELRFVASLKDLASDLRQASFLDPEIKRSKRLTIISAVGGTDAFIARIKSQIQQRLVWKEVRDKDHLVEALGIEQGTVKRWKDRQEIENGYEQIKTTQEITTHLGVLEGFVASSNGGRGNDDAFEEDVKPDIRWLQEHGGLEDWNDEEEERALYGEEGGPTRKRRRVSNDEDADAEALRKLPPPGPSRLHHLCSQPRRRATERARAQGLLVDAFTQKVDSELQLGEWDHGEWTLFDEVSRFCAAMLMARSDILESSSPQSLDPIEPALQVLIARAIRDAAYPPHLRLYDYKASQEQLEDSVPWLTKLLRLASIAATSLSTIPQAAADSHPYAFPD
ncbi:BQ2448_2079 [Microbotryum intermedium]|uniref:BQ2448_2079 protein n=1 Tax=Microbotryum intermedium TaxID=269621 RepID=A0A238F8G9_9BASI|nr:BQ2448_2079 [Microbotryum intermedium]